MQNNTLEISHGILRMIDKVTCIELLMDYKREIDKLLGDPSNQQAIDAFKRMIKNLLVNKGGFVPNLVIDEHLLNIIEHVYEAYKIERVSAVHTAMKDMCSGNAESKPKGASHALISNGTILKDSKWGQCKDETNPMTRGEIADIINAGTEKGLNIAILGKIACEIENIRKYTEKYGNVIESLNNLIKSEIDFIMPGKEGIVMDDKVLEVIKFLTEPSTEKDPEVIAKWLSE